ncbi:MAG: carboxypeptidase-like regulatory domain-containing protein [Planctomycetota bacterium]|nr:carboxypeptidase-like regulatory domain-containing protein [Planctomycetota bacterium]
MSSEHEKRSGGRPGVKHGAAGVALIVLVVLVIGLLLATWLWTRGSDSSGSTGPSVPAGPSVVERPSGTESAPAPTPSREQVAPVRDTLGKDDPDRFRGRGRIRGDLVAEGVEMPQRWTLVLEPHPTLVGAEHAARRRIEYEHGETRFEASDLTLGGYRVLAEAPGLNSTSAAALLVRGSTDVHVTLRLVRAGLVDGFVFDSAGRPAEGIAVTIESRRTRARSAVEVDATGMFVARDVVDGEYQIFFGAPERPLVPPGDFTFRAPTLRWRETRLPPTGTALVQVRDARGSTILDANVEGSGSPQGVVRGRTGADGELLARFLWPARYEIRATAPDGRAGRATANVTADAAIVNVVIVVE